MSYKKPPEPEDDEDFLTKISVKLPSVGGVVSMGDVYNKKKKKFAFWIFIDKWPMKAKLLYVHIE